MCGSRVRLAAVPTVRSDFTRDLIKYMAATLHTLGYRLPDDSGNVDIASFYYEHRTRLISARPRKVFVAPELVCPPQHQGGSTS